VTQTICQIVAVLFFLYGWAPPTCSSLWCDKMPIEYIGYFVIVYLTLVDSV